MKNYNPKNPINQAQFHKAQNILLEYTPGMRAVLNYLIQSQSYYRQVFPKQETIASKCNLSRSYVNEILGWLEDDGLVKSYYRNNHPKVYTLSKIFFSWQICDLFSTMLPGLSLLKTSGIVLGLMLSNIASGAIVNTYIKNSSSNIYIYNRKRTVLSYIDLRKKKKDFEVELSQKRRVMKQFAQSDVDRMLEAFRSVIPFINLTNAGMKELLAFPHQAITWSLTEYRRIKASNIRDHFKFFYSLCQRYCKENDVRPDYDYTKNLQIPSDIPRYEHKTQDSYKGNDKVFTSAQVKQREEEKNATTVKKVVDIDEEKSLFAKIGDPSNIFAQIVMKSVENQPEK